MRYRRATQSIYKSCQLSHLSFSLTCIFSSINLRAWQNPSFLSREMLLRDTKTIFEKTQKSLYCNHACTYMRLTLVGFYSSCYLHLWMPDVTLCSVCIKLKGHGNLFCHIICSIIAYVTIFINTYLLGLVICMCTICIQGLKKLENGIESSGTEIDRPL